MASQGRYAARLMHLPRDVLADLAARAIFASGDVRRAADDALALHDPTPAWAVDRILTSPDLVQYILRYADLQYVAAAAACKAWYKGWTATAGERLKPKLTEETACAG